MYVCLNILETCVNIILTPSDLT